MKSIVLKEEEATYYKHTYAFLPLLMGVFCALLIYLLYNLTLNILYGMSFQMKWNYIWIAFGFGFLEGLMIIYLTFRNNNKKIRYYNGLHKAEKNYLYLSVILKKGILNHEKGVLLINKDRLEYKTHQAFDNKLIFHSNLKDVDISFQTMENHWLSRIVTLSKKKHYLNLKTEDKEYRFIIPSLNDISHRFETHKIK